MPALDSVPAADDPTGVTAAALQPQTNPARPRLLIQLGLSTASALLLVATHEPWRQFYLAWVALVPLMLALRDTSIRRAALIGFVAAMVYFPVLLYWIWHATFLGAAALVIWSAAYWAIFGAVATVIQRADGSGQRAAKSLLPAVCIPAAWTALEWVRSWMWTGFPMAMISHSQVSLTTWCQVADFGGEFAVTFWVVAVNTLLFLAIVHRRQIRVIAPAATMVLAMLAGVYGYGKWRLSETQTAVSAGPTVMVVQSNFPHQRGGARTVTFEEQIKFHFETSEAALRDAKSVELVAWSETVLPAMNPEAVRRSNNPDLATRLHQRLIDFTREHNTSLVFGAYALLNFPKDPAEADVRTSAYFYSPALPNQPRYDKVHLVPFGEIVPFKHDWPWLHRLLFRMAAYSVQYVITPGSRDALTVFALPSGARFVTPICYEDMDGILLRQMLAPQPDGRKRADFIVNITNDGWFDSTEKKQHLAGAAFRSIENRVWTARSCNTGISGFIDSAGRWSAETTLPPNTTGTKAMAVGIDRRIAPYARIGNAFAVACATVAMGGLAYALVRGRA
jgi:apolipoprotein N-acyltransferase